MLARTHAPTLMKLLTEERLRRVWPRLVKTVVGIKYNAFEMIWNVTAILGNIYYILWISFIGLTLGSIHAISFFLVGSDGMRAVVAVFGSGVLDIWSIILNIKVLMTHATLEVHHSFIRGFSPQELYSLMVSNVHQLKVRNRRRREIQVLPDRHIMA